MTVSSLHPGITYPHRYASAHRRKRSGQAFGSVAMGLLLVLTVVVAVTAGARTAGAVSVESWTAVSVPEYGTLWDLAESHPAEGLSTAGTVELIRARNALASATIYEGQTILVPSMPDTAVALAER